VLGLGGIVLALAHAAAAEIVVAMVLIGVGVGLVYAMLAKLIVDAVPPRVTGVAMGVNTVMRTIGGVIGGQVGAALLSAMTIPGTDLPQERAFTTMFLVAGAAALLAVAAVMRIPGRRAPEPYLSSITQMP
jgi:MFS family permease